MCLDVRKRTIKSLSLWSEVKRRKKRIKEEKGVLRNICAPWKKRIGVMVRAHRE